MVWHVHRTRLCMLWVCILCQIGSRTEGAEDRSHERTLAAAIAAQPLARALAAFSASTRLQIVYVSQLALNKNSQAVPSGLPLDASLERLLTDTGVDFLFLNDRTLHGYETPRSVGLSAADIIGERRGREGVSDLFCLFFVFFFSVHCWCIASALLVHCWCIAGALMTHCWCIASGLLVHCCCIDGALQMHCWCIADALLLLF